MYVNKEWYIIDPLMVQYYNIQIQQVSPPHPLQYTTPEPTGDKACPDGYQGLRFYMYSYKLIKKSSHLIQEWASRG